MTTDATRPPAEPRRPAPAYALLYPGLVEVARNLGYAIAVHGSMKRDLDLIAVPWVEHAEHPLELVEAIRAYVDGWIFDDHDNGVARAHGRRPWSIYFTNCKKNAVANASAYIDLSIMPRAEK